MFITLLTHVNEPAKTSNTGALVLKALSAAQDVTCERVIWARKAPDEKLLERLAEQPSALVYPTPEPPDGQGLTPEHYVLIDATWQQSRKILNHSPYLQALPRVAIARIAPSRYNLRRNQLAGGLCTSECAAELLRQRGRATLAGRLDAALEDKLTER